jgi:hypothetical protein
VFSIVLVDLHPNSVVHAVVEVVAFQPLSVVRKNPACFIDLRLAEGDRVSQVSGSTKP